MANQNGNNGADVAVMPRPQDLSEAAPHGAGEHGFSGLYADAAHGAAGVAQTSRRIYLVMHDDNGERKTSQFDGQAEAQSFIEELLAQGVSREAIDTFRGSKLDFDVTFRPVVSFGAA